MSHYLWTKLLRHIVSLGSVGVALPIAAILFAWLCVRRRWRTGIWCAVAVLGCSGTIFFLKLAFFARDLSVPGLENPSGHSAVAAGVYGELACKAPTGKPALGPLRHQAALGASIDARCSTCSAAGSARVAQCAAAKLSTTSGTEITRRARFPRWPPERRRQASEKIEAKSCSSCIADW